MDDLALTNQIRTYPALDPFTANLEGKVEVHQGCVCVRRSLLTELGEVESVVRTISGVVSVRSKEPVSARDDTMSRR